MSVIQIVGEAVAALLSGDTEASERLLRSLDVSALEREKEDAKNFVRIASKPSTVVNSSTVRLDPHGNRTPPPSIQIEMFRRDGFTCRYKHCQRKTFIPPLFRALSLQYPDLIRWHKNWRGTHPLVWLYTASVEHIVPWADSRSSNPEINLITTCFWCNQIKSRRRKEELGWEIVDPVQTSWDGLTSSFCKVLSIVSESADQTALNYFSSWRKVL